MVASVSTVNLKAFVYSVSCTQSFMVTFMLDSFVSCFICYCTIKVLHYFLLGDDIDQILEENNLLAPAAEDQPDEKKVTND